jgi:hypothetical protein
MRALSLLACCVLAGCSLINDPGAHQPESIGAVQGQDFCAELAKLLCTGYFECCSTAEHGDDAFENCVASAATRCADGDGTLAPVIGSLVTNSRTGYDPVLAGQALAEGYALVAECSLDIAAWKLERTGLQRALTGTISGGDTCTPHDPGTSGGLDWAALFSCEGTDKACVAGRDRWSCLARQPEGMACVLYWDCEDGLYCDGHWIVGGGSCRARLANGEPCTEAVQCATLHCASNVCATPTQDDLYCTTSLL